jgi:hypothetical protein
MNIANIIAPKNTHLLLIFGITILYLLIPLAISIFVMDDPYLYRLAIITTIAVCGIYTGFFIYRKRRESFYVYHSQFKRKSVNFLLFIFILFVCTYFILFVTSDSIPIISAILGADPTTLSDERGAFLKERSGFLLVVSYIFSILISSVIPFCVILLFEIRSKFRFPAAIFVGFVCISFLVKAMFLNLILPLLSFAVLKRRISNKSFFTAISLIIAGIILLVNLAGYNKEVSSDSNEIDITDFISVAYAAPSATYFFVWRAIAIPILAARDTLQVHDQQFGGKLLVGATSGTISRLIGAENINMERIVFAHQYGGWSDIGNTNTAFMVDAYINFGYVGVFIYGVLAAFIISYLTSTPSVAMSAMALLFVFFLLGTSLVGIFLSNGFFVLVAWIAYQQSTIKRYYTPRYKFPSRYK